MAQFYSDSRIQQDTYSPLLARDFLGLPPPQEDPNLYYITIYNVEPITIITLAVLIHHSYPFGVIMDYDSRPDGLGNQVYLGFRTIAEAYHVGLALPMRVAPDRRWFVYIAASNW